jgi:hypothetical protein
VVGVVALMLVVCAAAGAQPDTARVIERVTASRDTTMHYAVSLPPGYDRTKRWPTLFVLDPRGRGAVALRLFTGTANRLGWIVLSSYETASDDPNAPNLAAINAMLADAPGRWRADDNRLYFAGLSGTARLAWEFANQGQGHVRGVLSAGAGFTAFPALAALATNGAGAVAWAGTAGDRDFNYSEVVQTDSLLAARGAPHRAWYFPGVHSWPPESVLGDALEWFESHAMRSGVAQPNRAFLDERARTLLVRADSLRTHGQLEAALATYREISAEFPRSPEDTAAAPHAAQIARASEYRALVQRRGAQLRDETDRMKSAVLALAGVRRSAPGARSQVSAAQEAADLCRALNIGGLVSAAASRDSVRAPSAARELEFLMANLLFYGPRVQLAGGDTARARVFLDVAATIDSTRASRARTALGLTR